jgi:monovalent cation/hydrogen antiporter
VVVFEWVIGVLLGAVALSSLARRLGVPYPIFLAVGGVALAFVPDSPDWTLDPGLALALFIAPVLLDAAYDTSVRDLKRNWIPVAGLAVAAVGVTTVCVALVARWLVPDMPLAAAIALGAIVAPPDAAAATAVARQVRLPHRLLKILEGESLLNDASALLIYRLAVGAVASGGFAVTEVAPTFLVAVIGSLVVGPALGYVSIRALRRIADRPSAIIVQFCTTFAVWILAERLGLSGILTIVSYAITVARTAPQSTPARLRVPAYAVWETTIFLLNVLGFVIIGLQLGPIWGRLDPALRVETGLVAAAVLATVIAARFVYVLASTGLARLNLRLFPRDKPNPMMEPTLRGALVVSWCGMRGIVSLAAAFALPADFPERDLILVCAFVVVLGTLFLQGLSLRPLIAAMPLDDGDPVTQEVGKARAAAYRAALGALAGDDSAEGDALQREYRALLTEAEQDPKGRVMGELPGDPLRRKAIDAARGALIGLRRDGTIGDDAFHRVEEELDFAELGAEQPATAS